MSEPTWALPMNRAELIARVAELEAAKNEKKLDSKVNRYMVGITGPDPCLYDAVTHELTHIVDGPDITVVLAEDHETRVAELEDRCEVATAEVHAIAAELYETQKDRQREHDLRVRLAGEVERSQLRQRRAQSQAEQILASKVKAETLVAALETIVKEVRAIMLAVSCLDAGFDDRHDQRLAKPTSLTPDKPVELCDCRDAFSVMNSCTHCHRPIRAPAGAGAI